MYKILDFAKLPHISHVIWDIDGTITGVDGTVNQEVAAKIINLALKGIYHTFVTGREAAWIQRNVVEPVKHFASFPRVNENLVFFAEVGCIRMLVDPAGRLSKTVLPELEGHPLLPSSTKKEPSQSKRAGKQTGHRNAREMLRRLAFDPQRLTPYKTGHKLSADERVICDAETGTKQKRYLVDLRHPLPKLHPYIWSEYKEGMATFEIIRDEEGKHRRFDQSPYVEIVLNFLKENHLEKDIDVEEVSTAINVLPKVSGERLGKAWAAGRALEYIHEVKIGKTYDLDTVLRRTVAFGDGKADFDFTTPRFSEEQTGMLTQTTLPIIFVGPENAIPNSPIKKNMIIQGTGQGDLAYDDQLDVIKLQRAMGARVVSAVLDFLNEWDYFTPIV